MICLRLLIRSRAVTNMIFFSPRVQLVPCSLLPSNIKTMTYFMFRKLDLYLFSRATSCRLWTSTGTTLSFILYIFSLSLSTACTLLTLWSTLNTILPEKVLLKRKVSLAIEKKGLQIIFEFLVSIQFLGFGFQGDNTPLAFTGYYISD